MMFRRLFHSFPKLKCLYIHHPLNLTTDQQLEQFCSILFDECPFLEKLSFNNGDEWMPGFKPLCFFKIFPFVRYLGLYPWDFDCLGSLRYMLENCPKLQFMDLSQDVFSVHRTDFRDLIQLL